MFFWIYLQYTCKLRYETGQNLAYKLLASKSHASWKQEDVLFRVKNKVLVSSVQLSFYMKTEAATVYKYSLWKVCPLLYRQIGVFGGLKGIILL